MCIFQLRYGAAVQKVKKAVESGKLGKLVLGDAYIKWYRSQAYYDSAGWRGTWKVEGGGALMTQGIHTVDLLQWIMGPVDTIFSFADHLARFPALRERLGVPVPAGERLVQGVAARR